MAPPGRRAAGKTLWRLLYETAARATEARGLDANDLDLANKRARVRSKGGATEWVFWQTGSAQLLPRLLARRTAGPVFLADRRPTRAVATLDQDSATGRARLSYRRAAYQFSAATGWTLHQPPPAASPVPARLRALTRALRPPQPRSRRPTPRRNPPRPPAHLTRTVVALPHR